MVLSPVTRSSVRYAGNHFSGPVSDPFRRIFFSAVKTWMNFRSGLFQENFEEADYMTFECTQLLCFHSDWVRGGRRTMGLREKNKVRWERGLSFCNLGDSSSAQARTLWDPITGPNELESPEWSPLESLSGSVESVLKVQATDLLRSVQVQFGPEQFSSRPKRVRRRLTSGHRIAKNFASDVTNLNQDFNSGSSCMLLLQNG